MAAQVHSGDLAQQAKFVFQGTIDKRGADLLFQVVAARYETGSIVLTTNRAFREWGTLFDVDNTLATALIDRLMHHGEALVIKGDSYRMKDKPTDPASA